MTEKVLAVHWEKALTREHDHAGILILDLWPPELWELNFCCLSAIPSVVFCYSSPNGLRKMHTQCISLVLDQGQFFPHETLGNIWKHFWLSQQGSCCWHLVSRLGMLLNILNAQNVSHNEELLAPNVNSSKVEKPWYIYMNGKCVFCMCVYVYVYTYMATLK